MDLLITLLFLFQLGLFTLGIVGPWRDPLEFKSNGHLPRPIRVTLSFSLLVAAFLIWRGEAQPTAYGQWVCFGMLASFVGDLVMARLIPTPNRLIGGMVAFSIAHALYITAYVYTIQAVAWVTPHTPWTVVLAIGLIAYGLFTLFAWWALIRNPQKGTALNVGALIYGLWIGVMASFALALAAARGDSFWAAALGGLFFVVSDLVIGAINIRGIAIKNANDLIWLTYLVGQMGIIYAGWLA